MLANSDKEKSIEELNDKTPPLWGLEMTKGRGLPWYDSIPESYPYTSSGKHISHCSMIYVTHGFILNATKLIYELQKALKSNWILVSFLLQ